MEEASRAAADGSPELLLRRATGVEQAPVDLGQGIKQGGC